MVLEIYIIVMVTLFVVPANHRIVNQLWVLMSTALHDP